MAERGAQIADAIDRQCTELGSYLGGLTEADLRLPCADPSGATVGAVLSHLAEGYGLVLHWLAGVTGAPQPGAGQHGPADDHELADPGVATGQVRSGGQALASMVRGLTGQQLDEVPAAAKDITDGTVPLAQIIERMMEHQSVHVGYVQSAVSGALSAERAS